MTRRGVSIDGRELSRDELDRLLRSRGKGGSLRDLQLTPGGQIQRPADKPPPRKRERKERVPDPVGLFDRHPGTRLLLQGEPVCRLTVGLLPSWNKAINEHRRDPHIGARFTDEWRAAGHQAAGLWIAEAGLPHAAVTDAQGNAALRLTRPLLGRRRGLLVAHVWRRDRNRADSALNLCIKPFADGLTDAGLWVDDDDRHLPAYLPLYRGVDRAAPRVEIELHAFDGPEVVA